MCRQVGSFWKVLSEQPIGVLVGASLPWTLRIAEVDINIGCQCEPLVVSEFLAPIPGQGFVELAWQFMGLIDQG